jgi:SAM-dependent methyltransferase
LVADARDLPFQDSAFHAVLEKGTLDAIYLSGGRDKELAAKYLELSVKELARVVVEGGIVVSITAACVEAVQNTFHDQDWELVRDGSPYISEDGYAPATMSMAPCSCGVLAVHNESPLRTAVVKKPQVEKGRL